MAARRRARSAPQDELVAHELAVVLTQGSGSGLVAGIGDVGAGGPLPHVSKHLVAGALVARCEVGGGMESARLQEVSVSADAGRDRLPLSLRGQPGAR